MGDVLWLPGMLVASVRAEAEMPDWVLCDGRTLDGTQQPYVALFAAIGLAFGGSGNNFKVPGMNEHAGNGSQARIPMGVDSGGAADVNAVGKTGGAFGHTHAAGTLTAPAHGHAAGALYAAEHGHGHNFSYGHHHATYADYQPMGDFGGGAPDASVENSFLGPLFNQFVNGVDAGVGGGIYNQGNLGLGGSVQTVGAQTLTGSSEAANPPYVTANWYVKL